MMLRNAAYIAAAIVAGAALLASLFIVLALAAYLPLAN